MGTPQKSTGMRGMEMGNPSRENRGGRDGRVFYSPLPSCPVAIPRAYAAFLFTKKQINGVDVVFFFNF